MTTTATAPAALAPAGAPRARARSARPWGLYLALLVVAWLAVSLVWPALLATHDPDALDLGHSLAAPGWGHLLGTDVAGRDLYSRIVWGTRPSLAIGVGAALVSLVLATVLGALAALAGRVVSTVVDRVVEVLFSFPSLLLALLLVALLGTSALTEVVAVGVGSAPGYARIIRGQILSVKGSAYVEAAVALGHSRGRILRQHVVPNALRPLVAIMALSIGQSIVWASSLSFLGLGVAPPSPEWGALLDAGRQYITHAWWLTVVPGLVIVVLALAATTTGKHLQNALERNES
jgi:peptide/nickel transport system permease protein